MNLMRERILELLETDSIPEPSVNSDVVPAEEIKAYEAGFINGAGAIQKKLGQLIKEGLFLTPDENVVLVLLKQSYDAYIHLPEQHPMHQQEFSMAIHQCQRLVMSRPTARVEGWIK